MPIPDTKIRSLGSLKDRQALAKAIIANDLKKIDELSAQAAKKAEAEKKAAWEADPKTRGLRFVTDTARGDLKQQVDEAEATLKEVQSGRGPQREKQAAYWEFANKRLTIMQQLQESEIKLVDPDLIARSDKFDKRLTALNKLDSDKMTPKQRTEWQTLTTQQQGLQNAQAHRLIEENRGLMKNSITDISRRHKEALEEGGLDTLTSQYRKGRKTIEDSVRQNKDLTASEVPGVLKKRLADFDRVFDLRGKQIAQQLENLNLGGAGFNTIRKLALTFQDTMHKIDHAVSMHLMSIAQAVELKAQQKTVYMAELEKAPLELQKFALEQGKRPFEEDLARRQAAQATKTVGDAGHRNDEALKRRREEDEDRADAALNLSPELRESLNIAKERQRNPILPEAEMTTGNANWDRLMYSAKNRRPGLPGASGGLDLQKRMNDVYNTVLAEKQRADERAMESADTTNESLYDMARKTIQTPYEKLQAESAMADDMAKISEATKNLAPVLSGLADIAAKIEFAALRQAVADSIKYLNQMVGGGKAGAKAKADAEMTAADKAITIAIAPTAGFTEKDVDAWIPKIREKLCKAAATSGARG